MIIKASLEQNNAFKKITNFNNNRLSIDSKNVDDHSFSGNYIHIILAFSIKFSWYRKKNMTPDLWQRLRPDPGPIPDIDITVVSVFGSL